MAKLDLGGLIKWIILIAVAVFVWKQGWPWMKDKLGGSGSVSDAGTPALTCAAQAENASAEWGSGIGRFVNPPLDESAWGSFRSRVDGEILQARGYCGCAESSCAKAREALNDLDSLVRSFDTALRSGSPPGMDAVTRQESIDQKIEQARALAKQGK